MKKLLLLLCVLFCASVAHATTYYVSPTGNDCNSGVSPDQAWQTIGNVNAHRFNAGDSVLFQGGQTFTGTLRLSTLQSGTAANPVTFGSYGTGVATISSGTGYGIFAINASGITVYRLNFLGTSSPVGTDGLLFFSESLTGSQDITIDTVDVGHYGGHGISVVGWASGTSFVDDTGYNDVTIRNSTVHDTLSDGISVTAKFASLNTNITIDTNVVHDITGNGITVSGTDTATVLNNTVSAVSISGILVTDSRNINVHDNNSHNNATGITLGQNTMDSIAQTNTTSANSGAGILLIQSPNLPIYTNNQVLFNTSTNDATGSLGSITIRGLVTNTIVNNNTVTLTSGASPRVAILIDNVGLAGECVLNVNLGANTLTTAGPDLINVTAGQLACQSGLFFSGNAFTATPFSILWGATTYTSCSAWRIGTGQENCPTTPAAPPDVISTSPNTGAQSASGLVVTITGTGFQPGATCGFGTGITSPCTFTSSTTLVATLTIASDAPQGAHTVSVTNSDFQFDNLPAGFTVTQGPQPAPTLSTVAPNIAAQGATLNIVLTGTGFQSSATSSFGSGVTVNSTTFNSATQLTANVTIAGGATLGTRTVTVTNPDSQSVSLSPGFTITQATPPAPTVTSATPNTGVQGNTIVSDVIAGTNFVNGAACNYGSGITVNSCTFNSSTQLTANITIALGALTGTRTLTVTNPDMQSGFAANAFTVTGAPPPPAPTVTAVNPDNGAQGTVLTNEIITGTGFQSGATCSFGAAGITVNSCTFNSITQLTANLTIDAAADLTTRDVVVTNPDAQVGTLVNGFTVTPFVNPRPTVTFVSPNAETQGATLAVAITGTGFLNTPTCDFGSGIVVNSCTANSATSISANISINAAAAVGVRTVTVTNVDAQSGSLVAGFSVQSAPLAAPNPTSATPNEGAQNAALSSVLIAGTGFQSGATCSFGSGITINSCTFNSGIQLTANLTIAAGATLGVRNIVITNPDTQTGTLTNGFTVTAIVNPVPTVTSVSPTNEQQGATDSITITGTGFLASPTCSFGVGITINTCVRNSSTSITSSITVGAAASPGARTVTVTNTDAQFGSLANGFTVTAAPPPSPTVTSINPTVGIQGTTITDVITGNFFQSGATCGYGAGITVNSCTFNSITQLTANLTIAGGATTGVRTVTVTNPDTQFGTLVGGFTVNPSPAPPAPTVSSVTANNGARGSTISVVIAGTDFVSGATCSFGTGVTINTCVRNSAIQIAANITIASQTTLGDRTVTVTNPDAQSGSLVGGFKITGPAFATITWTDNSSLESGNHVYRNCTDTGDSLAGSTAANVNTFDDTFMPQTQSCCYKVAAFNGSGESARINGNAACFLPFVPQPPITAMGANEASGTLVDDSADSLDGTFTNGARIAHSGYGLSLNFNSASALMSITGLTTSSTQRTWEFWFFMRSTGTNGVGRLFDKNNVITPESEVMFSSGSTLKFQRPFTGGAGGWTIPLPSLNVWHHCAIAHDAASATNTPRWWIDGVEQAVTLISTSSGTPVTNTQPVTFGNNNASSRAFDGDIDEIRIYNRLLSTYEVQQDMITPLP